MPSTQRSGHLLTTRALILASLLAALPGAEVFGQVARDGSLGAGAIAKVNNV